MKILQKQQDILCPRAESRTVAYLLIEFTPLVITGGQAKPGSGPAGSCCPSGQPARRGIGVHRLPGPLRAPAPVRTKARVASRGQRKLAARITVSVKS